MAGLTGCASLNFQSPVESSTVRTPASWRAADRGVDGRISQGWLAEFSDRKLTRVVDQVMENNRDLAAATARMRAADYNRIAGRARLLPSVDGGGSGSFTRFEGGPGESSEAESYGLSISASWEVDLWGRLRDLTAAEDADFAAVRASYRGARLSLAATAARAWFNLITAEEQLQLARITLDSFERNLRISERNYQGTGEGALDVQFGRTNVASAQRSLESRGLERDEAARTLEVLTGAYPAGSTAAAAELPELKGSVPVGIPATLLDRRPDLAVAAADIYASAKRADAARKSLLPSLALTGSSGNPVSRFSDLLDPRFLSTTIAANLAQNLYSGGALTNQARAALEQNRAALDDFSQIALEAFREVESALAADRSLAEQETYLRVEVEQAALAERQSTRDYSEGIEGADILGVLEAQRRANNARAALINLRNDRLQNRIDLHLALGGDFRTEDQ